MITQNTPSAELLKEFKEDYKKASYWKQKQYRSNNRLEQTKLERKAKAMRMKQDVFGDVVDYHSPNGNRWRAMDLCRYYPETNQTTESSCIFMYWDTYGSVGAIMPLFDINTNEVNGAMLFTSHFFMRVAQRKNIKNIDSYLVLAFMMQNPMMYSQTGKDNNGNDCVDMCSVDGLCRGYYMTDDDGNVMKNLIEFRTFLNDNQLSPLQRRNTKKLREARQFIDARPNALKIEGIAKSDDPKEAMAKHYENLFRAQGAPKGFGKNYSTAVLHIGISLTDFNLHPTDDEKMANFAKGKEINQCSSAIQKLVYEKKDKWNFLDLLGICLDNIPGYDANKGLIRYSTWFAYDETQNQHAALAAGKEVEDWLDSNNYVLTKDNYHDILDNLL